jgi:hypothetical protein
VIGLCEVGRSIFRWSTALTLRVPPRTDFPDFTLKHAWLSQELFWNCEWECDNEFCTFKKVAERSLQRIWREKTRKLKEFFTMKSVLTRRI